MDLQKLEDMGVSVRSWEQMLKEGSRLPRQDPVPPTPEDLSTIMYTSGTTGAEHTWSAVNLAAATQQ